MASCEASTSAHPAPAFDVSSMRRSAQEAVRAKPTRQGVAMTPSVGSILRAFDQRGDGDREMLMLLLEAKRAEDQRLAALDFAYGQQCQLAAMARQPRLVPSPPALSSASTTSASDEESPASPPARPPTTWHGRLGKRPRDEDSHKEAMREVQARLMARRTPVSSVRGVL